MHQQMQVSKLIGSFLDACSVKIIIALRTHVTLPRVNNPRSIETHYAGCGGRLLVFYRLHWGSSILPVPSMLEHKHLGELSANSLALQQEFDVIRGCGVDAVWARECSLGGHIAADGVVAGGCQQPGNGSLQHTHAHTHTHTHTHTRSINPLFIIVPFVSLAGSSVWSDASVIVR